MPAATSANVMGQPPPPPRRGADWGAPVDTARIPGWRFLGYAQTHDQVGNRAVGDRLSASVSAGAARIAAALVLTSPFTPMLFMGEEWAASTPFQFFTSHPEYDLGKATAEGRIDEFERMGWDPAVVPDPQDPATFERSKLDWSELEGGRHAVLLDVYRRLAELRRRLPQLTDPAFTSSTWSTAATSPLSVPGSGTSATSPTSTPGPGSSIWPR